MIAKNLAAEMDGDLKVDIIDKENLNNDCIMVCFTLRLPSLK